MIRRLLLVLGLVTGMLLLTPEQALACSCVMRSTAEQVQAADTVLAGTIEWTSTDGQQRTYSVRVDGVYKGAAAEHERLISPAQAAACGLGELAVDRRYLFFAQGEHPGQLRVNLCGGSTAYSVSLEREVIAASGIAQPPLPDRRPIAEEPSSGFSWAAVAGVAGIAAVLVGAVVLGRRRSRPASVGPATATAPGAPPGPGID